MAEVSLPMEMQYFPPSVAARARSYRQSIVPVNAPPYKPTERIRIVLGTTPGTYLNTAHSYIEFEIENIATDPATQSFRIDKHASAFIDRIEVYHAGALLDTVASANVLYSTLLDASVSRVDLGTTHVVAGCQTNTNGLIVGRAIAPGGKIRVCMPLIGLLSPAGLSRYLPLGDAVNGNIEIDLYLAPALQPVRVVDPANSATLNTPADLQWQLNNVQYMAQLVEIDSAVHAALMQSIGGIYTLPYNSWRTYTCPIPANSTSYTHYIPTKVSSLSGVIVQLRETTIINSSIHDGISTRSRGSGTAADALRSAQLRVGALNFPLKPVDCSTLGLDEALIESLKMFGRLGTSMGGTNMDRGTYSTVHFFVGFDTQAYSAASAAVDDGVQAQHGSTYLQLEFGSSASLQMDICILFDGMLTVANGAISAAF